MMPVFEGVYCNTYVISPLIQMYVYAKKIFTRNASFVSYAQIHLHFFIRTISGVYGDHRIFVYSHFVTFE